MSQPRRVLTLNGGSSSIKFALIEAGEPPRRILSGAIERIGLSDASLRAAMPDGTTVRTPLAVTDANSAVRVLLDWLEQSGGLSEIAAMGHRIVHGGPHRFDPQLVTPTLLSELRQAVPFDPNHLPAEIAIIEALLMRKPDVPQVACFDTAFHRNLPAAARLLPIPRRYADAGLHRYGFHGLSYSYLLAELEKQAGTAVATGRIILAHLGAGASLAAVRGRQCIDTTMGLTPASGLVMGTRTGDLDPGVLIHLVRTKGLTADQLDHLVNRESGLLGLSGTSSDMRDLLATQATDGHAAEAVDVFCYQTSKFIGAYAAALAGLDTLVFSGGIGENAPEIRHRICAGLEFLGIRLNAAANTPNHAVISEADSTVTVRVIPTDEEVMIAQSVFAIVKEK